MEFCRLQAYNTTSEKYLYVPFSVIKVQELSDLYRIKTLQQLSF